MNKRIVTILMILMMVLTIGFQVFANGFTINVPASENDALTSVFAKLESNDSFKLQPKAGEDTGAVKMLTYDNAGKITFNQDAFKGATTKSKKAAVKVFVNELQNSSVSSGVQQDIFTQLGDYDTEMNSLLLPIIFDETKADVFTAYKILRPFLMVVRVIFGIGSIVITLVLVGSTVLDLAYIGLPMFRSEVTGKDGKGTGKTDDKPWGISYDAISVVKYVESHIDSGGKYKNAYWVYLRRRSTTYILLGVAILYLLVGEIGGLMAFLMNLGSGLVN